MSTELDILSSLSLSLLEAVCVCETESENQECDMGINASRLISH